jgi:hypothetical protein
MTITTQQGATMAIIMPDASSFDSAAQALEAWRADRITIARGTTEAIRTRLSGEDPSDAIHAMNEGLMWPLPDADSETYWQGTIYVDVEADFEVETEVEIDFGPSTETCSVYVSRTLEFQVEIDVDADFEITNPDDVDSSDITDWDSFESAVRAVVAHEYRNDYTISSANISHYSTSTSYVSSSIQEDDIPAPDFQLVENVLAAWEKDLKNLSRNFWKYVREMSWCSDAEYAVGQLNRDLRAKVAPNRRSGLVVPFSVHVNGWLQDPGGVPGIAPSEFLEDGYKLTQTYTTTFAGNVRRNFYGCIELNTTGDEMLFTEEDVERYMGKFAIVDEDSKNEIIRLINAKLKENYVMRELTHFTAVHYPSVFANI